MTSLHDWFQTPPGERLLAWERAQMDAALADVFGYHALQLGQPRLHALATNRIPHRWLMATTSEMAAPPAPSSPSREPGAAAAEPSPRAPTLVADSTALPFAEGSLDLVVLPHTLESSADPHATLREVRRVLVHEGRVAIAGFNPASLWGFKQARGHLYRAMGSGRLFLPAEGRFIAPWRLRDWLALLEFDLESIAFGCYGPALGRAASLARFGWMERAGARWWPIFGAAYVVLACKRTAGARLIGPAWKKAPVPAGAPVSIAGRAGAERAGGQKDHEPS